MDTRLHQVWNQRDTPVILNRGKDRPRLRLPWRPHNRDFIIGHRTPRHRRDPEWNPAGRYWEIPRSWFSDTVAQCVSEYGATWIIQPFREKEICAPACWNALGDDCSCTCMGANHGSQHPDGAWTILSDILAVRWGERTLACRLIGPRKTQIDAECNQIKRLRTAPPL